MRFAPVLLAFLLATLPLFSADMDEKTFLEGLRKNIDSFNKIDFKNPGQAIDLDLKFRTETIQFGGESFDGLRFTAPPGSDKLDWIWYFNAPANWGHWYIVPAAGPNPQAFRNWLNADKLYKDLDRKGEKDRLRVLQTLDAGFFKPGQDYIVWFNKASQGTQDSFRARIRFVQKGGEWDHESLEKELALVPMDAEAQVENLESRGGKILLDPAFFEKHYAEERIDSVFLSERQTQNLPGGVFITMETSIPPCKTYPSYAEIRKKYGEADFVQSSEERELAKEKSPNTGATGENGAVITYYYDYFAFQVSAKNPDGKVLQVSTHSSDYADLRSLKKGDSFGQIPLKNLTVFYRDDQEVGRAFGFLESRPGPPLFSKEPPLGKYRNKNEILEYLGQGKWLWLVTNPDGAIIRKIPLVENLIEGKAETYYPSGKIRSSAAFSKGMMIGEMVKYSENGEVLEKEAGEE